jgi:hypothetical protein
MALVLCIGGSGTGKSYWLAGKRPDFIIPCTNKSHKAVLQAIATALGLQFSNRDSIDDLISSILAAPPARIGLDDVDRSPAIRLPYTLMNLATRHTILATATDKKRIRPILDRQAAILESPPTCDLAELIRSRYPGLTPTQIRHITSIAQTPAAALNAASNLANGLPIPQPKATDMTILLVIGLLTILYLLRFQLHDPTLTAALIAVGYAIRRLIYRYRS